MGVNAQHIKAFDWGCGFISAYEARFCCKIPSIQCVHQLTFYLLIALDISEDSVRVCENDRYRSNKMIMRSTGRPPFEAEFIVADCCEVRMHVHVHVHADARAHIPHVHGMAL